MTHPYKHVADHRSGHKRAGRDVHAVSGRNFDIGKRQRAVAAIGDCQGKLRRRAYEQSAEVQIAAERNHARLRNARSRSRDSVHSAEGV